MMFCQTVSCWHSIQLGSMLYKEIFLFFFLRCLFFCDEIALFFHFSVHKRKHSTHSKFQDMIQQYTLFATYPFVKHVDLRQVGLTMSNKKA